MSFSPRDLIPKSIPPLPCNDNNVVRPAAVECLRGKGLTCACVRELGEVFRPFPLAPSLFAHPAWLPGWLAGPELDGWQHWQRARPTYSLARFISATTRLFRGGPRNFFFAISFPRLASANKRTARFPSSRAQPLTSRSNSRAEQRAPPLAQSIHDPRAPPSRDSQFKE